MAQLLTGKEVVAAMADDIKARVERLAQQGIVPTLAIVRVGERPDDLSYERTAEKRATSLGIAVKKHVLDSLAPEEAVRSALQSVDYDAKVHGCLLFRPLPSYMNEKELCDSLVAAKDVDGISLESLASVFTDGHDGFRPARPRRACACSTITEFPSWASTWWSSGARSSSASRSP